MSAFIRIRDRWYATDQIVWVEPDSTTVGKRMTVHLADGGDVFVGGDETARVWSELMPDVPFPAENPTE